MIKLTIENVVRCVLFALIPALIFYLLAIYVLSGFGFTLIEILRDPAQQTGQSTFAGFVSSIGIWLWISSAAICFFGAATGARDGRFRRREVLVLAGLLSLTLGVDDFFMIHDRYVKQVYCYVGYAFLATTILVRHIKAIVEIDVAAYLVAGGLLALSIATDLAQRRIPLDYETTQMFEEGFKFTGAAVWLYFCTRVAAYQAGGEDSAVQRNPSQQQLL